MATWLRRLWPYNEPWTVGLPPELFYPIIEYLGDSELYQALFVCKFIHDAAERILYHTLELSIGDELQVRLKLFRRLAESPNTAAFVRELTISQIDDTHLQTHGHVRSYWRAYHNALKSLPNLLHLSIITHPEFRVDLAPSFSLLSGCTFQLRTLKIRTVYREHYRDLELQREIEELDITCSNKFTPFSEDAFPKLRVLTADPLPRELARRTATALHWNTFRSNEGRLEVFELVTAFRTHWIRFNDLPSFAVCFPALRYLRIDDDFLALNDVLRILIPLIASLPFLEKLHFEPSWRWVRPASLAASLFAANGTLQSIVMGFDNATIKEWRREEEKIKGFRGRLIASDEDEWKDPKWITPSQ